MRAVCIIQARLTSSRLPGKVLLKIGEHEALWHTISRCCYSFGWLNTVVAIPATAPNDALAAWLRERQVRCIRGPEDDVWARYVATASAMFLSPEDWIVRITGDCPFIDAQEAIGALSVTDSGFISNTAACPPGRNVQCVKVHALYNLAWAPDFTPYHHEHVVSYYDRPEKTVSAVPANRPIPWPEDYRCTLDTQADYEWFQRIAAEIDVTPPIHPTPEELLALFARRPDLIRTQGDYEREKAAADLRQ